MRFTLTRSELLTPALESPIVCGCRPLKAVETGIAVDNYPVRHVPLRPLD